MKKCQYHQSFSGKFYSYHGGSSLKCYDVLNKPLRNETQFSVPSAGVFFMITCRELIFYNKIPLMIFLQYYLLLWCTVIFGIVNHSLLRIPDKFVPSILQLIVTYEERMWHKIYIFFWLLFQNLETVARRKLKSFTRREFQFKLSPVKGLCYLHAPEFTSMEENTK